MCAGKVQNKPGVLGVYKHSKPGEPCVKLEKPNQKNIIKKQDKSQWEKHVCVIKGPILVGYGWFYFAIIPAPQNVCHGTKKDFISFEQKS